MNYKVILDLINKEMVPSFVLIYGEELYLIDHVIKSISSKYLNKDYESMNYFEFDSINDSFNEFFESVTTFPFMSDKKICVIKDSSFLMSTKSLEKSEEKKLIELIEKSYDTCIVIFIIKGGKADSRKKIVKKLKENKSVFEINKLNEMELNKYIIDSFKKEKISIDMADVNYISQNCGYLEYESTTSLYEVNNEVNKLISYCIDNKKVGREDIDSLMIKSTESNIFKLVDFICVKNKDEANEILEKMLLNNTPEQLIIYMIIRQYRMIYEYLLLYNKKYKLNDIMDKMKIKKFIANKLSNQARNTTIKDIEGYMQKCLEIDKKIKIGEIDKKIGLEILINGM